MRLPSFEELTESKDPKARDLKAVLRSHAGGGWPISSSIVIEIIKRIHLSQEDKRLLCEYARVGVTNRNHNTGNRRAEQNGAAEYDKVIKYLLDA